jgi:hypothetical protein
VYKSQGQIEEEESLEECRKFFELSPTPKTKKRRCLKCNQEFMSHEGTRRCEPCLKVAKAYLDRNRQLLSALDTPQHV